MVFYSLWIRKTTTAEITRKEFDYIFSAFKSLDNLASKSSLCKMNNKNSQH